MRKIIHFEKSGSGSIAENNNLESIKDSENGYLEWSKFLWSKRTCEDVNRYIGIQLCETRT